MISADWEADDPKLRQLSRASVVLPHTRKLAEAIALDPSGILFVRGPRQAGKSTFLRQFVQKALSGGFTPGSVGLLEAESLETRQDLYSEIVSFTESKKDRTILLIDEITSIDDWWRSVKLAADEGKLSRTLLVCTGSSSMDLAEGADRLPGRRGRRFPLDYELLPVSFRDVRTTLSLSEYLLTGGFPWPITEFVAAECIPPFVYELYSGWLQGAIVKRTHSARHLGPLLHYLSARVGTGVSVTGLARDCGIGSNHTAETLLSILEMNYACLTSRWAEPGSQVTAPRKNRKFYPFDPFLYHIYADIEHGFDTMFMRSRQRLEDPHAMGALVECLVASELRRIPGMNPLRYFLGKKEIDFVGETAIEVKYQNRVAIREFEWVRPLLPKGTQLTVITKHTRSQENNIRLIPLEDWLLEER